ncbi:kinase-like protein, partial [Rozella allomycis CSF55]
HLLPLHEPIASNESIVKMILRSSYPEITVSTKNNIEVAKDYDQILHNELAEVYQKLQTMTVSFLNRADSESKSQIKEIQLMKKRIGNIIGFGLYRFRDSRREKAERRDYDEYMNPSDGFKRPLKIEKVIARIKFKDSEKTILIDQSDTVEMVLQKSLQKHKLQNYDDWQHYILRWKTKAIYFTEMNKNFLQLWSLSECMDDREIVNLTIENWKDVIPGKYKEIFQTIDYEIPVDETNSLPDPVHSCEVERNVEIKIVNCEDLPSLDYNYIYLEAHLMHGEQVLTGSKLTSYHIFQPKVEFKERLLFDFPISKLPRYSEFVIKLYGLNTKKYDNGSICLFKGSTPTFEYNGIFKYGNFQMTLFNVNDPNAANIKLNFEIPCEEMIIIFSQNEKYYKPDIITRVDPLHRDLLERALSTDPLDELDQNMKNIIFRYRYCLTHDPLFLSKYVNSIDYSNQAQIEESHILLQQWSVNEEVDNHILAMELLGYSFRDATVRDHAVKLLSGISNHALKGFLSQFIQCLKNELYFDNSLIRFLLEKSLNSRTIGHTLFWYLKAEIEEPEMSIPCALYLEAYLRACSSTVLNLLERENKLNCFLINLSKEIKLINDSKNKLIHLRRELGKHSLHLPVSMPYDQNIFCGDFIVEKCKIMDSKKQPLWCAMNNHLCADDPIYYIFKEGDDLRQDMLTLQMLNLMNNIWKDEGFNFHMKIYNVICTGKETGFIQVVRDSQTVSCIQKEYGGSTAAFKDQPISDFIKQYNPSESEYLDAVDIFTRSCAAYCVATYILGIGDRHNDNIMVTKQGHLFHIDFGHFLGNIKRKFGIKRERAPFVLTPDFVYVMKTKSSDQFDFFIGLCVKAYNIIRKHGRMFLVLFKLMLSTGIPELTCNEDIFYLRDALKLDLDDVQAEKHFKGLISESLRLGWSTQLNWLIHNLAH